ncbi:MAG TPA: xanthine dehydrogenase family protein molybdopterin-binding subunit, partial [Pseudolabrys sp.]|nr:xanthine dehydrogenase family protein molybdopterin-binding subunit [Pseudolabrys sp.]
MPEHQFRGRREDQRLVTGRGRYTTDNNVERQAACSFVRADRAHARIVRVGIEAARKQRGVIDIVTGADLVAAGWKTPPVLSFFKGVGGSSLKIPFRAGLAHDRVRFVGEPVAIVVANSPYAARDAAESVAVEYEELPVV